MSRVDVGGVGIEYDVTGDGAPVVLLHGFPTPPGPGGTRLLLSPTPDSRS
jgi:pimeloyl-ACP methyl ester carboxylesterase